MYLDREGDSRSAIWAVAASAAPIVHIASGMTMLSAATAVGISWLLQKLMKAGSTHTAWGAGIRWVIYGLTLLESMKWLKNCWPGQTNIVWVILILLILGAVLAEKGEEPARRGGVILWWFAAFLLGSVLISAVPEIRLKKMLNGMTEPDWDRLLQLIVVLQLCRTEEREKTGTVLISQGAVGLLSALCAGGVLCNAVAVKARAPFYELSRSIRLYGNFERMESLAWLGLMTGMFLYISFVMNRMAQQIEETGICRKKGIWISTAVIGVTMLFWKGIIDPRWVLSGLIISNGIGHIEKLTKLKRNCRKKENSG